MELIDEQPKKKKWLYIVIVVLIIAIAIVYFTFLSPGTGGFLSSIFKGKITDLSLVPDNLKKDVTGGISELKFTPQDILENPRFKSLRSYAEPVEITAVSGRPNPFVPF